MLVFKIELFPFFLLEGGELVIFVFFEPMENVGLDFDECF